MKDGKYEVGDVIAFRWTGKKLRTGEVGDAFTFYDGPTRGESIFCNHGLSVQSDGAFVLERIPNPKLMDGEWWKGWTLRYIKDGETAPEGALFFIGCVGRGGDSLLRKWSPSPTHGGHSIDLNPPCGQSDRYALIPPDPPKQSPCPELAAKIAKMESDLADLKKQALGK